MVERILSDEDTVGLLSPKEIEADKLVNYVAKDSVKDLFKSELKHSLTINRPVSA